MASSILFSVTLTCQIERLDGRDQLSEQEGGCIEGGMYILARRSCGLGETPSFADERALRHGGDKVYVGARDVLPDQARGTISWREFMTVYDSLFEGPFTKAQGGRITVQDQRFTARSLSSKSGGPDACRQRLPQNLEVRPAQ